MKIVNENITTAAVKPNTISREKLSEANVETAKANRDHADFRGNIGEYAKEIKSNVKVEYDVKKAAPKVSITSEQIAAEIQRLKNRERRPIAEEEPEALPEDNENLPNIADKTNDTEKPSVENPMLELLELQREMLNSLFL